MKVKVKKLNKEGIVRLESGGEIKEILINEDFIKNKENIALCFRGKDSSGIIELKPDEIEKLMNSLQNRTHLIKGLKIIKGKLD